MILSYKYQFFVVLIISVLLAGFGLTNFEFQPSVASSGMGGVLTLGYPLPSCIGLNPSLLSLISKQVVETSFTKLYWGLDDGELTSGYLGYVQPGGRLGVFGINARTDLDDLKTDFIVSASYANSFISPGRISLGANINLFTRLYRENSGIVDDPAFEGDYHSQTLGVDVGLLMRPVNPVSMGLSFFNINKPTFSLGEDNILPLKARFDLGFNIHHIRPSFSVSYNRYWNTNDSDISFCFGFETGLFRERMQIRAGYDEDNLSCGLGLKFPGKNLDFAFDYAFQLPLDRERMSDTIGTHRAGLSFIFGRSQRIFKDKRQLKTYTFRFKDELLSEVVVRADRDMEYKLQVDAKSKLSPNQIDIDEIEAPEEVEYGLVKVNSSFSPLDVDSIRVITRIERQWIDDYNITSDNIRLRLVSVAGEEILDYIPVLAYSDDEYYYFETKVDILGPMVLSAYVIPVEEVPEIEEVAEVVEVAELEEMPEVKKEMTGEWPKEHTVVEGECLFIIAGFAYHDPFRWPLIYNANRDKIKDPHWIYPGQVFIIPAPE